MLDGWLGKGEEKEEGGGYLDYDLMPSPTGCVSSGSGASLSALSGLSGGGRREGGERGVGGGEIGWWGGAGRGEQGGGKREGGRGGGGDEATAGVACAPRGCRPVPPDPLHP